MIEIVIVYTYVGKTKEDQKLRRGEVSKNYALCKKELECLFWST